MGPSEYIPTWLFWSFWLTIAYYIFANAIYIVLMFLSFRIIRREAQWRPLLLDFVRRRKAFLAPSVSILVPAYNEEKSISSAIGSFLSQDYPNFEVIVINDGSKDQTLKKIVEDFKLQPKTLRFTGGLTSSKIHGTYVSEKFPNLMVIDKENGGKADSLNMGISFSRKTLVCCVDADSLLESDALLKVALPFVEHPDQTIAAGGTIRVVNGSEIKDAKVIRPALLKKPIILFQVVEYLRSFMCGRVGWNALNSTLVISGAFGLFSRRAVVDMGGYEKKTVGEDMELILNLHQYYRLVKNEDYRVYFVPDPVCWTEVPSDWRTLKRQRSRWQRGLYESLRNFKELFFNPRMGAIGFLAYPYFLFIEFLSPVVEVFSYIILVVAYFMGYLNTEMVLVFFLVGVIYGVLITVTAILIEEFYFSRYLKIRDFYWLMGASFIEAFGPRQVLNFFRLWAIVEIIRGKNDWGKMKRAGF